MKLINNIYFPDRDEHFHKMMPNGYYQRDTFLSAMEHIKEPKIFYDIGAHVGLWSIQAGEVGFKEIHAYEPNPESFECLKNNVRLANTNCYKYGVGRIPNKLSIVKHASDNTGAVSLEIVDKPKEAVNIYPIDSYPGVPFLHDAIKHFELLPHQTLVKVDTEGMEYDCLLGMELILYAFRPVVVVEQRTNHRALELLDAMGMEIVNQVRKDYILRWKSL